MRKSRNRRALIW